MPRRRWPVLGGIRRNDDRDHWIGTALATARAGDWRPAFAYVRRSSAASSGQGGCAVRLHGRDPAAHPVAVARASAVTLGADNEAFLVSSSRTDSLRVTSRLVSRINGVRYRLLKKTPRRSLAQTSPNCRPGHFPAGASLQRGTCQFCGPSNSSGYSAVTPRKSPSKATLPLIRGISANVHSRRYEFCNRHSGRGTQSRPLTIEHIEL